jgi:pimeloyl-ACP methyl ester carboxylesterase
MRSGMGDNTGHARALAGRMPNGKAEVINNVGHLVHMEATEMFNALTLEFINTH